MLTNATSSGLRELENLYTLLPYFVRSGFTPFLPEFDSGVDFIAYREHRSEDGGDLLLKVQLKGRWTIDQKYLRRAIVIAFRDGDDWFVIPHDEMVAFATEAGYTRTASWQAGTYSVGTMGAALRHRNERWRLSPDTEPNEQIWQRLRQGQS